MMRRGPRGNGMEPGEKKGISLARGRRSTEGTFRNIWRPAGPRGSKGQVIEGDECRTS
jgi:hypothetical protein